VPCTLVGLTTASRYEWPERIAAEQRRLQELHRLKRQREIELERIASIERNEQDRILAIERELKFIGAFCTREISLPSVPQCCAVLSPASLEKAIAGVGEPLVFVADVSGYIHVIRMRDTRALFRIRIDYVTADRTIRLTSMVRGLLPAPSSPPLDFF
jgi:hypothetical protein